MYEISNFFIKKNNPKKEEKEQKQTKNPKETAWLFFLKKQRFFSPPGL